MSDIYIDDNGTVRKYNKDLMQSSEKLSDVDDDRQSGGSMLLRNKLATKPNLSASFKNFKD